MNRILRQSKVMSPTKKRSPQIQGNNLFAMAENYENNALRLNGNNNINMLRIESLRNINEDESVMYNTEL